MTINISNWRIIGIISIITAVISIPLKLFQYTSTPRSLYIYDIFTFQLIDLNIKYTVLTIILLVSFITLGYSITNDKPRLSIISGFLYVISIFVVVYASFHMGTIDYFGWGFYLITCSSLFVLFTPVIYLNKNNIEKFSNIIK